VYLAEREGAHGFRTNFALKELTPADGKDRDPLELVDEAQAMNRLRHPAIVRATDLLELDAGNRRRRLVLVMEYVESSRSRC
jgi:serine/threonine protein kinase